ncbi:MAG: hypothetical protein J7K23_04220 [Thermoproteales archaeon]|nr:hypothetical protein [Thermoproteales archaeon]
MSQPKVYYINGQKVVTWVKYTQEDLDKVVQRQQKKKPRPISKTMPSGKTVQSLEYPVGTPSWEEQRMKAKQYVSRNITYLNIETPPELQYHVDPVTGAYGSETSAEVYFFEQIREEVKRKGLDTTSFWRQHYQDVLEAARLKARILHMAQEKVPIPVDLARKLEEFYRGDVIKVERKEPYNPNINPDMIIRQAYARQGKDYDKIIKESLEAERQFQGRGFLQGLFSQLGYEASFGLWKPKTATTQSLSYRRVQLMEEAWKEAGLDKGITPEKLDRWQELTMKKFESFNNVGWEYWIGLGVGEVVGNLLADWEMNILGSALGKVFSPVFSRLSKTRIGQRISRKISGYLPTEEQYYKITAEELEFDTLLTPNKTYEVAELRLGKERIKPSEYKELIEELSKRRLITGLKGVTEEGLELEYHSPFLTQLERVSSQEEALGLVAGKGKHGLKGFYTSEEAMSIWFKQGSKMKSFNVYRFKGFDRLKGRLKVKSLLGYGEDVKDIGKGVSFFSKGGGGPGITNVLEETGKQSLKTSLFKVLGVSKIEKSALSKLSGLLGIVKIDVGKPAEKAETILFPKTETKTSTNLVNVVKPASIEDLKKDVGRMPVTKIMGDKSIMFEEKSKDVTSMPSMEHFNNVLSVGIEDISSPVFKSTPRTVVSTGAKTGQETIQVQTPIETVIPSIDIIDIGYPYIPEKPKKSKGGPVEGNIPLGGGGLLGFVFGGIGYRQWSYINPIGDLFKPLKKKNRKSRKRSKRGRKGGVAAVVGFMLGLIMLAVLFIATTPLVERLYSWFNDTSIWPNNEIPDYAQEEYSLLYDLWKTIPYMAFFIMITWLILYVYRREVAGERR